MTKLCDEAKGSSGSLDIKTNVSLNFDVIGNALKEFACKACSSMYSVYTEIDLPFTVFIKKTTNCVFCHVRGLRK